MKLSFDGFVYTIYLLLKTDRVLTEKATLLEFKRIFAGHGGKELYGKGINPARVAREIEKDLRAIPRA